MESIARKIGREEFDYQTLLDALAGYARPRDKITDLLRKRVIVRVKKGLYILGENYRKRPYSRELLANLAYGPSYLSLESALQHHGLIPERVEALMSVTTGRSRRFETPVGLFIYRQIPLAAFRIGMRRVEIDRERAFLIATAEKALADKVRADRGNAISTIADMQAYLEDNLRADRSALARLNPSDIGRFADRYRSRKVQLLAAVVERLAGDDGGSQA